MSQPLNSRSAIRTRQDLPDPDVIMKDVEREDGKVLLRWDKKHGAETPLGRVEPGDVVPMGIDEMKKIVRRGDDLDEVELISFVLSSGDWTPVMEKGSKKKAKSKTKKED